jgi:GNAT superfamily N-acetyltransferase
VSRGFDDLSREFVDSKLDGPPPLGFDCGRSDQNEFLYDDAWRNQQDFVSTTYLFFVDGILAGYASVLTDLLPLGPDERGSLRYSQISAVKLGQLGVDRRFQGLGIGRHLVGYIVDLTREVGERVACRYLTLDAQPDLVPWYESQGFVRNRVRQEERIANAVRHRRDPARIPVSMRFDMRDE